MPIYTCLSLKGGVGKTTTVLHLATVIASEGRPVTVLDADEEHSAVSWCSVGGAMPFDVVAAEREGLAQQVRALAKDKSRVVLIDTPPNNREILTRAGMLADVCIVPVVPTGLDLNRLTPTLKMLAEIEATRGSLVVAILLSRWDGRTILGREAVDALKRFPLLKARIRALERYAQSFGSVPTYLDEYRAAWRELRKHEAHTFASGHVGGVRTKRRQARGKEVASTT
jgi:chromosome partitioning protein